MKTLFAGMAAVLGLMMVVPATTEAQECKTCFTDGWWEEEEFYIGHKFLEEGTAHSECLATEDLEEESAASGPEARDECAQCHEDWIFDGTCSQHDFCNPGEMPLADLIAEVDQLVSSLSSDVLGARDGSASKLVTRVVGTVNLTVDHNGGALRLSDCGGQLITTWRVPEAFIKLASGGTH